MRSAWGWHTHDENTNRDASSTLGSEERVQLWPLERLEGWGRGQKHLGKGSRSQSGVNSVGNENYTSKYLRGVHYIPGLRCY